MIDIQQGFYDTIKLQQCVAAAKEALRIDTTDDDTWMYSLANEGLRALDCLTLFEKQETCLDIIDLKAQLPPGFWQLIGARLGCSNSCNNAILIDLPFLKFCGVNTSNTVNVNNYYSTFDIQDGWMCFHQQPSTSTTNGTTTTTTNIDTVHISYWGLNVDDDGIIKVRPDWERAIRNYILWQFKLESSQEYNHYVIDKHERVWVAQKRWIKGTAVQEDFRNKKRQIAEVTNAWIVEKAWSK
jgi:hypothetical protein